MKITLEDYQPGWAKSFELEKQILASILFDFDPKIEHVGSTAIPGLCAKPTIDILAGLPDETQLDRTITPMMSTGYTYFKKYEPAMPYRRLFAKLRALTYKKPPPMIDVHDAFVRGQDFISSANIHVIVKDTLQWKRHLAFRDFLRAHADQRDEYGRLKTVFSMILWSPVRQNRDYEVGLVGIIGFQMERKVVRAIHAFMHHKLARLNNCAFTWLKYHRTDG